MITWFQSDLIWHFLFHAGFIDFIVEPTFLVLTEMIERIMTPLTEEPLRSGLHGFRRSRLTTIYPPVLCQVTLIDNSHTILEKYKSQLTWDWFYYLECGVFYLRRYLCNNIIPPCLNLNNSIFLHGEVVPDIGYFFCNQCKFCWYALQSKTNILNKQPDDGQWYPRVFAFMNINWTR